MPNPIRLDTDQQIASVRGGDYHLRTVLTGGSATLNVRIKGGETSFGPFTNNVLSEGLKVITLPEGDVQLTKSGSAIVELEGL